MTLEEEVLEGLGLATSRTTSFRRRHGLDFPAHLSDFNIDLLCWRFWRDPRYKAGNITDPHELFIKAMRSHVDGVQILSPEEWALSRWGEQHVYYWTHEDNLIVWGCASSSKSWDFGLLSYVDWAVSPLNTITLMCSTSKEALQKRTFASVVHYAQLFKYKGLPFPGNYVPSRVAITLPADDESQGSTKVGIFGVAVKEGPVAEAVGKIRGMHADGVRLIVDELSAMPPAVWDPKLRYNLKSGAKSCKTIGLTNIDSWNDLAGRNSEPVGGRESVSVETEVWRTKAGVVLRHDGFKSPAIVEEGGEKRYPHLLNKSTLEAMIQEEGGNADAPALMTMIRAFPPSTSNVPTMVSEAEARQWGMCKGQAQLPRWRHPPRVVVGLDGGFGGDQCALQRVDVGFDEDGRILLWFDDLRIVPVSAAAGARPVQDQILGYCLPLLTAWNVDPRHFGIDDSGPQGLADAFARAWNLAIVRMSFGSSAGELPVSAFNQEPASRRYADRATELVALYREYGQYRQIRNVDPQIVQQLASRETLRRGGRLALIDKKTYKKTTGRRSPDAMDAGAIALGVVRYSVGLAPGASDISPLGPYEREVNPGAGVDEATIAEYNNL